jgi:hypothetical protein
MCQNNATNPSTPLQSLTPPMRTHSLLVFFPSSVPTRRSVTRGGGRLRMSVTGQHYFFFLTTNQAAPAKRTGSCKLTSPMTFDGSLPVVIRRVASAPHPSVCHAAAAIIRRLLWCKLTSPVTFDGSRVSS